VKVLLLAAAAPVLALSGVTAGTGVALVEVRDAGQGVSFAFPVPLLAADVALAFVPRPPLPDPDLARVAPVALGVLHELREAPDGELVHVTDRGETVSVRKDGDLIRVHVRAPEEDVRVAVPFEAAERFLEGARDGRLELRGTVRALRGGFGATELVHVRTGEEEVRIRVW
jgi:hypothetical protein